VTGVAALIRAIIRRDRIRLGVWLAVIPILHVVFINAFGSMFNDDPVGLAARGALARTPTSVVFGGPAYGADNYTLAVMFGNELTLYYAIALAIGAATLIMRATREDEERGAYELVGAAPVGRFAQLTASMITVSATMLIAGALIGTISVLVGDFDVASSFVFGIGIALCAISFAALACLTAQLATSAKSGNMAVLLAIAAAFMLRALGDFWGITREPPRNWSLPSFFSPLAWVQQARPFVDLRVWPILLYIPLTVVLVAAAFLVQSRRDYGQGVFAARLGRSQARASLNGVLALNLRLVRMSWINWAGFAVVYSIACGPLMGDIESYMASNPEIGGYLGLPPDAAGALIVETFVAMLVWFAALFSVCFALSAIGRFRSDETSGLLELQLALPVSRNRLLAAHGTIALVGAIAITWLGSLALGMTIPSEFRKGASALGYGFEVANKSLAYVPALALSVALAVLLIGAAPKLSALNWALLGWAIIGGLFGPALGMPKWAVNISPIAATPQVPMVDVTATPLVVMSVLAILGCAAGVWTLSRRDIKAG
jgi:ABC-2 type transport system permease protein